MTKQSTAPDPVETSRVEVERLNSQELSIAGLYRQKSDELASVRADRGDKVLAAEDPAGVARESGHRVSALLEEREALADASKRARERRVAAIPAVFEAEARAKERQAGELEAEAAKLEAESKRLRAALERHDEWAYFAAQGSVDGHYFQAVPQGGTEFRVIDARGPVFKRRLDAAQALRAAAAQYRLKTPGQAGMIEADTVDELIAAVHSDAMRIGPTIDAIASWSEQAIGKERRRRERSLSTEDAFTAVDAPMRLRLEWRNGAIDPTASGVVFQPELTQVQAFADGPAGTAAAPAANDARRRTPQGTTPYDTGPTPQEIAREAASTKQSIEEVAEAWGVPVPAPEQVEA
jgi:hypothetical protein